MATSRTDQNFFTIAISKQVVPRATKVALLVGTILAIINHGEKIITLTLTQQNLFQIALTYLVPYSVSTWSAVRAIQSQPTPATTAAE